MAIRVAFFFFLLAYWQPVFGQISPPGLGSARTAGWLAVGLRQELDTLNKNQSVTYIGLGTKSNPDNYNPYHKFAILVLNEEFYNQFHKHWQYSVAFSYRRQDEYLEQAPYELSNPNFEQEFRLYGRFAYVYKSPKIKFTATLRQEFRKFYEPNFANWSENFQLRSRLKAQLAFTLDKQHTQRLIGGAESLFSIAKESVPDYWTSFATHESRFTLYYSVAPKAVPFVFDVGYMNDFLFGKNLAAVQYIAVDVIWENPLSVIHRHKKLALPALN